jgi:hypothetical protein
MAQEVFRAVEFPVAIGALLGRHLVKNRISG